MGKQAQLKRLRKEQSLAGQGLPSRQVPAFELDKKIERLILAILFIIIICIGIGMRLSNLNIQRRSPDEGVYAYQANRIAEHGIEGTRQLIREYINDKSSWVYPPPTRIGYDYLLAIVMKISATHTEMAGTYISVFASIGALLILLIMGLRFFSPWATLIALLGMSVSPMDLAIARRCWQDSLLAFCGVSYIYLCGELVKNPKRKILYIPLLVVGIYCMLIKESGIVIFGLGILWLLYHAVFKEKSVFATTLTIMAGIAGLAGSLAILATVAGGISSILEIFKHVKEAMPTNTYAVEYQTGPWYRIIEGFWILAPLFTVLAFAGFVVTFLYDKLNGSHTLKYVKDNKIVHGVAFFAISFLIITIITPYCQNMRYVSVTFVPFYLFSGIALWLVAHFVKEKLSDLSFFIVTAVIIIAVIMAAVHDYQVFRHIFLERGIVDLSIRLLREHS